MNEKPIRVYASEPSEAIKAIELALFGNVFYEGRTCCDTTTDEPHECSNPSTNPALREEDE